MRIQFSDGKAVADQLAVAQLAVNSSLEEITRLGLSILDCEKNSALAPSTTQKALHELAATFVHQVDTRQKLVTTQAHLVAIKGQSSLQEVGFGCLGDGSIFGESGLRIVANGA